MAGALLTAAGLPELITYNLEDYERVALALANDSERCIALREKLKAVRNDGVLFDTPRFARDLEARFELLATSLPTRQSMALGA
jgi:predicted O-linked N-acetylglucosamine transferase (SPINDLY family)